MGVLTRWHFLRIITLAGLLVSCSIKCFLALHHPFKTPDRVEHYLGSVCAPSPKMVSTKSAQGNGPIFVTDTKCRVKKRHLKCHPLCLFSLTPSNLQLSELFRGTAWYQHHDNFQNDVFQIVLLDR